MVSSLNSYIRIIVLAHAFAFTLANFSFRDGLPIEQNRLQIAYDDVNYRLPNTSHPVSYDLTIWSRVDLGEFNFSGNVRITIVVDEMTHEIVLHARQLNIVNIKLGKYHGTNLVNLELCPFAYDNVPEFLKIRTNSSILNRGDRLLLNIDYIGVLRNDRGGFYRSSYLDRNGHTK